MTADGDPTTSLRWVSDQGLLVTLGEAVGPAVHLRVMGALDALRAAPVPGVRNLHPAYASILVVTDPRAVVPAEVEAAVRRALGGAPVRAPAIPRTLEIPVCYAPPYSLDLEAVGLAHGLTPDQVVHLHAAAVYTVHFLGFAPGFPYLEGLPAQLATPRLAVPRQRVPAGSVAIGGEHAGIYSVETPGGWRVIGRTPWTLFAADRQPPTLLQPGDRVRFLPVDRARFEQLGAQPR